MGILGDVWGEGFEGDEAVKELERAFLADLEKSVRLERAVFARRPFSTRLAENACRLLSPIL